MALFISALFFAGFLANVVAGAFFEAAFLSDVQEMLCMALAVIAFVVAILKREADAKSRSEP